MRRRRSALATLVIAAALTTPGVAAAHQPDTHRPDNPPGASGAPSAAQAALTELVTASVRSKVAADPALTATAWADTRITVSRNKDDRWAFGTAVLVAPKVEHAQPRDWLFVAERSADTDGTGTWRIGLDGEPAFAELSARSAVVTDAEKAIFAGHDGRASTQASGDFRTGMRLPYGVDQSWAMLGGPHAYDAGSGPWSSLDLAGGDQRVLSARQGVAYTMCTGLIRVVHDRGYSTRYYHLVNHLWVDGASVSTGTFLGYTGTEDDCGGSALARHVHFSLMQHGAFVGIAYHSIGKWVFLNGGAQYDGSALHGSTARYVGSSLRNYGALGWTQGLVDADGDASVNRRSGPGTGYPVVGSVADGSTVSISCSRNGTTHEGRWGATAMWNRLTDGTWVSDAFLYTGIDGPVNGWC
jgi:LasA protease